MSIIRVFFYVVAVLFGVSAAAASDLTQLTGCSKSPCHPKADFYGGGSVAAYENAAQELKARRWIMVLENLACVSGCSYLAALAPKYVCLNYKERALVFGFHLAGKVETSDGTSMEAAYYLTGSSLSQWMKKHGGHIVGYKKMDYPPFVDTWVGNWGGYPKTENLLLMRREDALLFWHKC